MAGMMGAMMGGGNPLFREGSVVAERQLLFEIIPAGQAGRDDKP
jgi:hypothetical protein